MIPHRILSLLSLVSLTASGADQTYDDSSSSDLWDTTTTNWDGSTTTWSNGNTAIFGGTGETVTVATVSTAGITINSTGYTLTGGSITSSGPITANTSATIDSDIVLGSPQSWSTASGETLTLGGVISGSNTLTYGGAGSYLIEGINTNSGNLVIDTASVTVESGATLFGSGLGWSGRSVTIRNGGFLSTDNYANGAGNLWGQVGDGPSNIILESGGTLEMTGTMDGTVNKGISVTAGETGRFAVPTGSSVSWTGAFSSRDFNSDTGSTLVFDIDGSFSTTRYLRGAGGYTKTGAGTLTLDQTNSFTGTFTINEGILNAATTTTSDNGSALGSGSNNIVVNSGGTLLISADRGAGFHTGSATINGGTITMNGNDLNLAANSTLTFDNEAGTIDGTGLWRRRGSGNTVAVTAAASGSTISVNELNLFDNNPTFNVADGTADTDLTISSAITGGAGLVKSGSGTLQLANTNSFSGTLTINGGILNAATTTTGGTASAIGGGSTNIVVNSGGTLLISGDRGAGYHGGAAAIHGGTITMDGSDLSFVNGNTLTFDTAAGTIDGSGQWRRRVSGNTVAVTAAGSGSTISVSELNLFDSNPTFNIADGAAAADLTISSTITGGSNLVKTGAGTLVIDGVSTSYTGTTQVNAGVLQVNGTLSGNVSVASGANLSGSGTLGGNTTIAGTHAPGNSPGVQNLDGDLTYSSGSIFEWELDLAQTDPETNRGTAYDGVNVGGSLSGSGATFAITLTGTQDFTDTFWASSRTWTDIFTHETHPIDFASVFSGFSYSNGNGSLDPTVHGSFSLVNSSLSWTPIPEPGSALVGLLISAGLLHRRRGQGSRAAPANEAT